MLTIPILEIIRVGNNFPIVFISQVLSELCGAGCSERAISLQASNEALLYRTKIHRFNISQAHVGVVVSISGISSS